MRVKNTADGWADFAKQVDAALVKPEAAIPEAVVQIDGALDSTQLSALQYGLMEFDRIEHRIRRQLEKRLTIHVNSKSDAYRIFHYFWLISHTRQGFSLSVFCNGTQIRETTRNTKWDIPLGRIFPLLCIGSTEQNRSILSVWSLLLPSTSQEMAGQLARFFKSNQIPPLLPSNQGADPPPLLAFIQQYILSRLQECFRELAGTTEESLGDSQKAQLVAQLQELLLGQFPRLSLLAQMLWAISLWAMACSKDLLLLRKDSVWELDMEAFHCSRLDAISYAEGLQQLIENACIHSEMRRGYLSIRIHNTDISGTAPRKLRTGAQNRIYLEDRIQSASQLRTQGRQRNQGGKSSYLHPTAKYYFEFQVVNDSCSSKGGPQGIGEKYFRNLNLPWPSQQPYSLPEIFNGALLPEDKRKSPEHLAQHYGLQVFEKSVRINHGYFYVASPGLSPEGKPVLDRHQSFLSTKPLPPLPPAPPGRHTAYLILLPITHHWRQDTASDQDAIPSKNSRPLFDPSALEGSYCQKILRFHSDPKSGNDWFTQQQALQGPNIAPTLSHQPFDPNEKMQQVSQLYKALLRQVAQADGHTVCLLDLMQAQHYGQIELLAKMLFLYIAEQSQDHEAGMQRPHLFALLLPSKEYLWEFIRIFSIFYGKLEDGGMSSLAQIALCAYPEKSAADTPEKSTSATPEVAFLLAGSTVNSARITARVFAYYNAGSTLEMIPQLRYLTRDVSKGDAVPQFPFDLFLTAAVSAPAAPDASAPREGPSWFLRQMNGHLQSDLWQRPLGCRIRDIKLRLHSNILISDFYEAELLFHNIGIIYRFAFLIARDLLGRPQLPMERPLALVGYENYSTVLVSQVAALLNEHPHFKQSRFESVHYLIYSGQSGSKQGLHPSPELQAMDAQEQQKYLTQADYLAVVPIGSTLSTIYRIQNAVICAGGRQNAFPLPHYSLILVSCENGGGPLASDDYWQRSGGSASGLVTLAPSASSEAGSTQVRYFLDPPTQWIQRGPGAAGNPPQEDVLVYLDQTSTIPRDIFVGGRTHFQGVSKLIGNSEENDRRIDLLKSCTHYGHLYTNSNHFQFYFDLDRYYAKITGSAGSGNSSRTSGNDLNRWLEGLRKRIDANAYNIIVSPLHQEDSPFAKAVADQVFEHSLRFLHIDFSDTFREDIRAKFSYVAEEYARIKHFDQSKTVNVYFVNTAITSGLTLQRARNLMMMLLEEAGVAYDRGSVFKGCFVLINRSGFDTLNSYIHQPLENFHAYVHLAVPSLNLRRDRCPTCELVDLYRTIEQRCASSELRKEFHRLAEKHEKRDVSQYLDWLRGNALTRSGYAGWLMQWLHCHVPDKTPASRAASIPVGIYKLARQEVLQLQNLRSLLAWGLECFLAQRGLKDVLAPPQASPSQEDALQGDASQEDASQEDALQKDASQKDACLKALDAFSLQDLEALIRADRAGALDSMPHQEDGLPARCLEPAYWSQVTLDYVCGQKNHMRIVSIHKTFLSMEKLAGDPGPLDGLSPRERGAHTAELLAQVIAAALNAHRDAPVLQAEWVISYFKVMSRPHLAQYHHIRQGILNLLLKAAFALLNGEEALPLLHPPASGGSGSPLWQYLCVDVQKLSPLLRYQLLKTILKRLAGLQSTYLLQSGNLMQVLAYLDRLRQDYFSQAQTSGGAAGMQFQPFPPEKDIRIAMVKLVKWAASCGDDEGGCYLIEQEFRKEAAQ